MGLGLGLGLGFGLDYLDEARIVTTRAQQLHLVRGRGRG